MNYMPILPICLFDLYRNPNAFILPQHWYLHEYSSFYRINKWDTVIIDNSMYERPEMFDFQSMINISKTLTAKNIFLVVPEDHKNPHNTVPLAMDCLDKFSSDGTWKPMTILHGTLDSVIYQYDMLKDVKNMGFGIAVSLWRAGIDRAKLYTDLHMNTHYIHAMGLDDIDELVSLRNVGIKSVDSSIPATAAYNNINLRYARRIIRSGTLNDPKRVPLNLPACSIVTKRIVSENIALINALCEG